MLTGIPTDKTESSFCAPWQSQQNSKKTKPKSQQASKRKEPAKKKKNGSGTANHPSVLTMDSDSDWEDLYPSPVPPLHAASVPLAGGSAGPPRACGHDGPHGCTVGVADDATDSDDDVELYPGPVDAAAMGGGHGALYHAYAHVHTPTSNLGDGLIYDSDEEVYFGDLGVYPLLSAGQPLRDRAPPSASTAPSSERTWCVC